MTHRGLRDRDRPFPADVTLTLVTPTFLLSTSVSLFLHTRTAMFASSSRHALRAGKHGLANVAAPRTLLASTQGMFLLQLHNCALLTGRPEASSSQRRTAAAQAVRSATSGSAYQPFAPGRSNRPFDYRADPTFKVGNKRGSELARANMELGRLVEDKRAVDAFKLGRSMKSRGLRPDRTTFDCLLTACKDLAFIPEAWAVLEDMVACGIQPDRNAFHSLLLVSRYLIWDSFTGDERCLYRLSATSITTS